MASRPTPDPQPGTIGVESAFRRRSPPPFASASRDRSRRCRDARWCAARRWLPSSSRRPQSSRPSPSHVRRPAPEPSQILARGLHAAAGSASSTARSDPALSRAPTDIESRAATANPNSATQGPARCRCPRSSPPYASGSNDPAAERARPCAPRSKACTSSRRSRQSRLRLKASTDGRKIRGPANAASQTTPR
jgi:hypothetical protein